MAKAKTPRGGPSDALEHYRRKRNFANTPEPRGRPLAPAAGRLQFVVQKHAARRLHYDFRLEHSGVLKSWAIPKGPSLDPSARRLAVQTEDHPLEYAAFEGIVPRGEYGSGAVLVWDRGYWEPAAPAERALAQGHLDFALHGDKLRGRWTLVRMPKRRGERAGKDNWLLIKRRDAAAASAQTPELVDVRPENVLSGRGIEAVAAAGDRVWHSAPGETAPAAGAGAGPPAEGPAAAAGRPGRPAAVPGARRAPPPDMRALAPARPRLGRAAPTGAGWLHEPRLEGRRVWCRIAAGRPVLQPPADDRALEPAGLDLPALEAAARALPCDDALLDGFVAAFDARGISDSRRLAAAQRPGDVRFVAFDLLHLDGWDLRGAALRARKELLRLLLADAPYVLQYGDHVEGHGSAFYAEACRAGLPGIVSKRADSTYDRADWRELACLRK